MNTEKSKYIENEITFDFSNDEINFLSLSPKQELVLDKLQQIDETAAQAYKAGLYFFQQRDFPLKSFFICHSFYLLYEIFMKADEQQQYSEFRMYMEENLRNAIKMNKWFEEDICDEIMKRKSTEKTIKRFWDDLSSLSKGKSYFWYYFIKNFRTKIKDNILQDMVSNIKEAMQHFHSGRHYNASKNPADFNLSIELVEDFILSLEQPYLEAKEVLDDILEETNTKTD